jgi:hypothetical protein
LVEALGLAIRLRMIARTHLERDVSKTEELLPEFACKHTVPVGDNGRWETMQAVYSVEENLGHTSSSKRVEKGQEMAILGERINDHQEAVRVTRPWKSFNEIQ